MIVTIVAGAAAGGALASALGENIAVLRRRVGASVLLVDAGRRQACRAWSEARTTAHLRPRPRVLAFCGPGFGARIDGAQDHYDDIIIDAGDCPGHECRCALIAAQVALVPLDARDADPARHYALIARLNAARMFNPGLHVLFVAAADDAAAAPAATAAVRAYAAHVMSGHVAAGVLPAPRLLAGAEAGRCLCDVDGPAALQLNALCAEVYQGVHARGRPAPFPACAP